MTFKIQAKHQTAAPPHTQHCHCATLEDGVPALELPLVAGMHAAVLACVQTKQRPPPYPTAQRVLLAARIRAPTLDAASCTTRT